MFLFQRETIILICPNCEVSCVKTGQRQKYCPKCSKIIRAEKSKVKSKEYRMANIEAVRAKDRARIEPEKNRKKVKEWAIANPEKAKALSLKWYENNKEKAILRVANWVLNNHERVKEIKRESMKRARKSDPDRYSSAKKERRKNPGVRLHESCSAAIRRSLIGNKSGASWEYLVGYTVVHLKEHLEKLFVNGMCWENYGEWHIDHIRPVSSFSFESAKDKEFLDCWSLSNIQPLWAFDNLSKGNKWNSDQHLPIS